MIEAATVKRKVTDWTSTLEIFGIGSEFLTNKHTPCPCCGGTDRYRYDNKHGNGDHFCSHCGAGDGISLIQKFNGWDFATTIKELAEYLGIEDKPPTKYQASKYKLEAEKKRYLKAIQHYSCLVGTKDKSTLTEKDIKWADRAIEVIRKFRAAHTDYLEMVGV